jgi:transcriptional regulator with XRE-family HTH domain
LNLGATTVLSHRFKVQPWHKDGAKRVRYDFCFFKTFEFLALDMDRGYMSAIENGKKNIPIQQLERLAQALAVSVDKLVKSIYQWTKTTSHHT